MGERGPSFTVGGKLVQPLWKLVCRTLWEVKINLPYDPSVPHFGICSKNLISYPANICSAVFINCYWNLLFFKENFGTGVMILGKKQQLLLQRMQPWFPKPTCLLTTISKLQFWGNRCPLLASTGTTCLCCLQTHTHTDTHLQENTNTVFFQVLKANCKATDFTWQTF